MNILLVRDSSSPIETGYLCLRCMTDRTDLFGLLKTVLANQIFKVEFHMNSTQSRTKNSIIE